MFETIVALATPPLKSALAIIRLSGDDCFEIVSKIFTKDLTKINSRGIHFGYIVDNNNYVDQVVLLTYVAPHSFTGEDSVEIICHGSMVIANEIIKLIISKGARMATNGEFSSRAYLNKKIDFAIKFIKSKLYITYVIYILQVILHIIDRIFHFKPRKEYTNGWFIIWKHFSDHYLGRISWCRTWCCY